MAFSLSIERFLYAVKHFEISQNENARSVFDSSYEYFIAYFISRLHYRLVLQRRLDSYIVWIDIG